MTRPPPVDRDQELDLLHRTITGKDAERILLISADGGMGKSELLRAFIARPPTDILLVPIDFKWGGIGLGELFFKVRDAIGSEHFPVLAGTVKRLVNPATVNISGNYLLGQNQIDVALNVESNEDARSALRATFTEAFFTDLRAAGRIVLVFDVFEACDPSVKVWLSGTFLPGVGRSPNLSVVIAGRNVPEPTLEWEGLCRVLTLPAIAAEHWHSYAKNLGIGVSLDFIKGCCYACKGHSLSIASHLSSLPREGAV
jgi:hypothetical protein